MSSSFHYPPEVLQLLVEVIPLLNRSKPDVFLFFKGAGVADFYMDSLLASYRQDRNSVNKYKITRVVLERLNEAGDKALTARGGAFSPAYDPWRGSCRSPDHAALRHGFATQLPTWFDPASRSTEGKFEIRH